MYVVRYEERSGGVKVNSPFCALYVRVDDPAAVKVTLGSGGTTGLFKITATPLDAFQSEFTCAAGIVGLLVRVL